MTSLHHQAVRVQMYSRKKGGWRKGNGGNKGEGKEESQAKEEQKGKQENWAMTSGSQQQRGKDGNISPRKLPKKVKPKNPVTISSDKGTERVRTPIRVTLYKMSSINKIYKWVMHKTWNGLCRVRQRKIFCDFKVAVRNNDFKATTVLTRTLVRGARTDGMCDAGGQQPWIA